MRPPVKRVRRFAVAVLVAGAALLASEAAAQSRPAQPRPPAQAARRPAPRPQESLQIRGVGMVSAEWFTANQSFDAILGSSRGTMFGGGLSLTEGPGFLDVTAQRFSKDGSRAFVASDKQVFQLGIPTTISVIPLDVTIGWRMPRAARGVFRSLRPYVGAGYTRVKYEETSDFADDGEDVSESFNGFHLLGGGEWRLHRWVGLAGEVMWTSVRDALGEAGVSKDFDEKDLGGTSLRLKLVIGR